MSGYGPIVTQADCIYFAYFLRDGLRDWSRVNAVSVPDSVWETVADIEAMGTTSQNRVNGNVVTSTAQTLSSANVEFVEVTIAEAAKIEGHCRQAVWARVNRRTLPARRDGRGHWRIRTEHLRSPK